MADSIPLSNAHLLKGLMPTNPHVLVPVESLTNSPTSSTGSASVLEWNSNSDSELFQMSSPVSAPTLTAQPTSPPLSPFSTTPSPVGSSRNGGPVVDSQYLIHWPELACERSPQVPPTPISDFGSPPATVADIDNVPALNEHPEELNILIERMVLSDLHDTVNKWQSEACTPSPAEDATQEDADSPSPKTPSPVTPEDTSKTSTILGYTHYDYTKDAKGSSSMTTLSPPALAQLSFFDSPPSPARSAEASIISIAEYFKRKASERATPSAGTDPQIGTAAVAAEERPASANSALSYFSPSVSPYPRQSTAPSSECARDSQNGSYQGLWDFSAQVSTLANDRASPSMTGSDRGRTNSDVGEEARQRRSSASTDVESSPSPGLHSPVFAYPYSNLAADSFRYFNRCSAPASGPIFLGQSTATTQPSQSKVQPISTTNVPSPRVVVQTNHASASFPNINCSVPPWVHSPELRTAPKNTNSTLPDPPAHADTSISQPEFRRMCHFNMPPTPAIIRMASPPSSIITRMSTPQTPPQPIAPAASASVPNSSTTATRKPRPPLPALPTAKPPMIPSPPFASPPFMFNDELPKPAEDPGTPFAQAFPSAWTCRPPPQPSLPPSSPSLTALLSDAEENRPRNAGRESVASTPVPPHPGWFSAQAQQHEKPHRIPLNNPYNSYGVSLNNPVLSSANFWPPYKPQPPLYSTNPIHSPMFGAGPSECWMGPNAYPPPPSSSPSSSNNPIRGMSPPHQRRLRFASPPTPTDFMYRPFSYLPRPPIPTYVPPPQVRLSPPQVPMGDVPYQNYMYSSPAPVIPPVAPDSSHAGWYTKSSKYCFGDATVVFRVETMLYSVHRHFFERHSEYFRKLLSTYWFIDGNHVFLPEVKKVDFERLLSIFYPTDLNRPDITTLKGWTSILTLAQKWDMAQLRVLALQNIGAHAWPMEKIIIAHTHGLHHPAPAWLLPAYTAVCGRGAPLALQEAAQLDMATVIRIWEVQHEARGVVGALGGVRGPQEEAKIGELVKAKFGAFESEAPAAAPTMMW